MIEFQTLGTIDLKRVDGASVGSVLAQPKRLALLSYLAVASAKTPQRRDILLGIFWPDLDQSKARAALRQSLHHLRRSLGVGVIEVRGDEELCVDGRKLRCDASAFERALEAGELREGLDLYSGDFLPGLHISGAPAFERWLDGERERLRELASSAAWSLSDDERSRDKGIEAARLARLAAEIKPFDETSFRRLIATLDELGDRAAALRAYEKYTARLEEELNVEPAEETRALIQAIRERESPRQSAPETAIWQVRPGAPAVTPTTVSAATAQPTRLSWPVRAGFGLVALAVVVVTAVLLRESPSTDATQAAGARRALLASGPEDLRSVAVLPIEVIGADPETEHFGAGITDDITHQLAGIGTLKVISSSSTGRYRDRSKSSSEIAEELGVATVLDGSVRLMDDRVRVVAQLIDARADELLWAGEYDRELTAANLFAIQREVAGEIASALRAQFSPGTQHSVSTPPTRDLEAYSLYMRGRFAMQQSLRDGLSAEGLERAAGYLREAIARDSNFALAYAQLAWTDFLAGPARLATLEELLPRARANVAKAVQLDPTAPEVQLAVADLELHEGDWAGAERAYGQLIELSPNLADGHWGLGYVRLLGFGDVAEAVQQTRIATLLDPLSPTHHQWLGRWLYYAGDYEGALVEYERMLELDPDYPMLASPHLASAHTRLGRYEDGIREAEVQIARQPSQGRHAMAEMASIYAETGRREEAIELLQEAKASGANPILVAAAYAALTEPDSAFAYLDPDAIYAEGPFAATRYVFLQLDPRLEPIRSDARWTPLIETLKEKWNLSW